ncbi:HpcH/HpaI aldolase/citrate lyase family protein [Pelagovum pacificum]|uniref:CoA ester lyase n=1 Tax=Pelagovum pacificum TaxID=2588711 RepID=A0A5C5G9S9_9RHOB|nr:CoA ester lyase [Pelagovum pacificum]QQA42445.1 CoA ester lyase [Pelagovum pacificum]TNY31528.1 CoA ester lyase [Pelagovum pacificum]
MSDRPFRSVLYVPGSKPRAMEKCRSLAVDSVIFDLEDAVAPDAKVAARDAVAAELDADHGGTLRLVRINGFDTEWGEADARALGASCDGIVVPKVGDAGQIDRVATLTATPVWAMMETPGGVMNAAAIAAHERVAGLVMGTNDLANDLGARVGPARAELQVALQTCLLAARAAGVVAIDGVFNAFRDEDGFLAECRQGRDLGFDGKSLIHPAQIAAANEIFGPSEAELDLARRQIAAYEAALAEGQAVAVLDGRIVEGLHVATARATLAKADAIRALDRQGD